MTRHGSWFNCNKCTAMILKTSPAMNNLPNPRFFRGQLTYNSFTIMPQIHIESHAKTIFVQVTPEHNWWPLLNRISYKKVGLLPTDYDDSSASRERDNSTQWEPEIQSTAILDQQQQRKLIKTPQSRLNCHSTSSLGSNPVHHLLFGTSRGSSSPWKKLVKSRSDWNWPRRGRKSRN